MTYLAWLWDQMKNTKSDYNCWKGTYTNSVANIAWIRLSRSGSRSVFESECVGNYLGRSR